MADNLEESLGSTQTPPPVVQSNQNQTSSLENNGEDSTAQECAKCRKGMWNKPWMKKMNPWKNKEGWGNGEE